MQIKHTAATEAWQERHELLCDRCGDLLSGPIESHGDISYGGEPCTPTEYVEKAKQNPNVWIVCGVCIEAMPDADFIFNSDGQEFEITREPALLM